MTSSEVNQEFKEKLLLLLRTDKDIRLALRETMVDSFVTREETNAILEEIKQLRIDTNKRMDQFEKRMEELRIDFNKRMEELRMDFNDRMDKFAEEQKRFGITLSAIGRRWGIGSEEAFREALKGLYEEKFGVKVQRWEYSDKEGKVLGYPSLIETDKLISDSEHTLIEIKAHVEKHHIAIFLKKAKLYEEVTGIKPSFVIINPFIEKDALDDS